MKDIRINIKEHIEFNTSDKEKEELVDFILFELMSSNQYQKIIKRHLNDLLDSEIEHKNDARLIEAYKTIINSKLSC